MSEKARRKKKCKLSTFDSRCMASEFSHKSQEDVWGQAGRYQEISFTSVAILITTLTPPTGSAGTDP